MRVVYLIKGGRGTAIGRVPLTCTVFKSSCGMLIARFHICLGRSEEISIKILQKMLLSIIVSVDKIRYKITTNLIVVLLRLHTL